MSLLTGLNCVTSEDWIIHLPAVNCSLAAYLKAMKSQLIATKMTISGYIYVAKIEGWKLAHRNEYGNMALFFFWTVFGWTVTLASIEALNPQYLFYRTTCTSLCAYTRISWQIGSCNSLLSRRKKYFALSKLKREKLKVHA